MRVFFLLLIIVNTISPKFLYQYQNESDKALVFSFHTINPENQNSKWDYFFTAAFEFPELLDVAERKKIPAIFICPSNLDGSGPIDDCAPFIEGARVALAWASTYFRFKNVDVRIAKIPNEAHGLSPAVFNNLIENIMQDRWPEEQADITPEKKMERRIRFYQVNSDLKSHNIDREQITELDCYPESIDSNIIIPKNIGETNIKRVLITGGAGFLGSHLARNLLNDNFHVIVLDSLLCASTSNIAELQKNQNFEFHKIDITKPYDVEGSLDYVIHFASVPSPEFYYRLPVETLTTGLQGVKFALDLAIRKNARFLYSSTSEVYGDPLVTPQPEEYEGNVNPWGKRSQYDESKRGGETICKWYFENKGVDIRIARIFNTYGPGMDLNDGRAVTNFIRAVLHHEPMIIHGDGLQTRSFCFVSDLINGLLILLKSNDFSRCTSINDRIFNIGNDKEFTINEIALIINNLANKCNYSTVEIKHIENPDATDPKLRRPHLDRIKKLGYQTIIDLENGLNRTFQHFISSIFNTR